MLSSPFWKCEHYDSVTGSDIPLRVELQSLCIFYSSISIYIEMSSFCVCFNQLR